MRAATEAFAMPRDGGEEGVVLTVATWPGQGAGGRWRRARSDDFGVGIPCRGWSAEGLSFQCNGAVTTGPAGVMQDPHDLMHAP